MGYQSGSAEDLDRLHSDRRSRRRGQTRRALGAVELVALLLLGGSALSVARTGSPSPLVWLSASAAALVWLDGEQPRWLPFHADPASSPPSGSSRRTNAGDQRGPAAGSTASTPAPAGAAAPVTVSSTATPVPKPTPAATAAPSPKPTPSPTPTIGPAALAIGSVAVAPAPAVIGQDLTVSGSGWSGGQRLVITLVQGITMDTLSNSVDVSSAGAMSWRGGVPGQFQVGMATIRVCYQSTTTCAQQSVSLVASGN